MSETQESDEHRDQDYKSYLKLSQLHIALREHLDDRYIDQILNREGDINYRIPAGQTLQTNYVGRTSLFFALSKRNVKAFNLLLNRGADFTAIDNDEDNSTVLHQILTDKYKKYMDNPELRGKIEDPFIDSILSSHVQFHIRTNPRNRHGLSHFHAACMTNNARAVEFFLTHGDASSMDEAVNQDSPAFPGYTALHFTVRFCALRCAEILLENGANMQLKDARGMTPLHLLLERNIRIMWLNMERRGVAATNLLTTDLAINEKMINLLLEYENSNTNASDDDPIGLSKFHVACAMRDCQLARRFLKHHTSDIDRTISLNSPLIPGCSPLHLAALFSHDSVKLLLNAGATCFTRKDANGVTPLDICLEKYNVDELRAILECQPVWKEILLSNGRTRLLDLLTAMRSSKDFATFLRTLEKVDCMVTADSCLWPNYTPLRLAITLYNRTRSLCSKRTYSQVIRECLTSGANINDTLYFAFCLGEVDLVNLLFQYHKFIVNSTNDEGWSHFHIACAMSNVNAVEKFILNGCCADVKIHGVKSSFRSNNFYIPSGSTALHIAVAVGSSAIVNILLKYQVVDVYAMDDDGLTSIHRSIIPSSNSHVGLALLTVPNLKERIVDGFSHLHVACFYNNLTAVKKLLGAMNVNATIGNDSLVENYRGVTPLSMAIRRGHWDVARLLLQHAGIDVSNCLYETVRDKYGTHQDPFIAMIRRDDTLLRDSEGGLTLLHIACKKIDVDLVKETLARDGVDVNGRTRLGGHTALHLLMMEANEFMHDHQRQIDVDTILKLLLDHGADVSLANDAMQTALLMADKLFYIYMDQPSDSPCGLRVDTMLRSIRDFNANPVDAEGVSHFHIACSWHNTHVVEQFLKQAGVDVNRTTDYFADQFAGCSALHLTLSSQTKSFSGIAAQLKTVGLLLRYGADANVEDSHGNTPLHAAAKYGPPRDALLEMIVRAGGDINAKNIYGETALEILLKSRDVTAEEIGFFLRHECHVNDFNPVNQKGYIPMTFSTRHHDVVQKLVFEAMINAPTIAELDVTGCTAIHNVVSTGSPIITEDDYADLIERLIKLGCDIDYQDKSGKTALHVATQFQNDRAISGLLSAGADINVIDARGKPAFAYSLEPCKVFDEYREGRNEIIKRAFAMHVHKLQLGKLDVSPINKNVQAKVLRKKSSSLQDATMNARFLQEIESTKDVKITAGVRTLFLGDFMSETGAVTAYPSMTFVQREAVDDFFESNRRAYLTNRFGELAHLLRLQYRKALARFSLIDTAKVALDNLTGIPLPDPCSEAVFVFLKNSELKSLIEASFNARKSS